LFSVNFSYGGTIGNTVNSHRLIEFSKQPEQGGGKHTDALVNALFKRYFEQEQDISADETLIAAAQEAGLPASAAELKAFLHSDALRAQVLEEMEYASQTGISGVPHFKINGRYAVSGAQEPDTFLQVFKKAGIRTQ